MMLTLKQRVALSAVLGKMEQMIRDGRVDLDEAREISALSRATIAALNEPPPRARPSLRIVRAEMAAPQ